MNYQDYKQILMDELWEQKPQEISEYQIKTIIKQNERISDCVTPVYADGGNLAPILYLEQFYDPDYDKEQIKTLASQLTNHFLEAHRVQSHFDISQINPQTAQTHLTLRLYNRALNPEIEQTCAHIDCLDLMAVPRWTVGNTQEISSSFLVNRELQRTLLHMTDDEILQIARANTMAQDYSIMGMNRLLREKLKEVSDEVVSEVMPTDAASEVMFVMTNGTGQFGATALLFPDELKKAAAEVGEPNFYVVPSSVHELVVIPCSRVDDPADLLFMMKSINAEQVAVQDRLGDGNVYRFDGQKLHICNSMEDVIKQSTPVEMEDRHMSQRRTL